jgi:Cu-Zn family superoxide dismutase
MSAGGHYNPEGHQHGLPEAENRHAGDLGNIQADDQGKAHYEISVTNISVSGAKNPIIGRSVIVHAKVDDGSQPTGNAGGRIACGVIGIANPGK